MKTLVLLAAFLACLGSSRLLAEPVVVEMLPAGLKRGQESTVTFTGSRLTDAADVLFYEPGVRFVSLESAEKAKMVVKIAVDADAKLGQRHLRLRTQSGVSLIKPFFVGQYDEIPEKEPNNTVEQAGKAEYDRTLTGKITDEDVDCWRITLKKDQRLSVEIEGWRLGQYVYDRSSFFDPHVSVLDLNRFELASSDDTALLAQDGFLSFVAPADGDYIVQVRDSAYDGGRTAQYRVHVGGFPRPEVTYPLGGQRGQDLEFTYVLPGGGTMPGKAKLPDTEADLFKVYAERDGKTAPSPNRIRVVKFPNVLEAEPNDREHATDGGATFPVAFNGQISEDGDEDWFKFRLKKDRTITVQSYARSLGSTLDSVVVVRDLKGKALASNDDGSAGNLDSKFNFKAPADGEYLIHVRDHLGRGRPSHAYRVELFNPTPSLTMTVPDFANNNSHYRKFISVPRGGRFATIFNVGRRSVSGAEPLKIEFPGLPAGVRVLNNVVPDGVPNFPVIFEAAPDAALAGGMTTPSIAMVKEEGRVSGGLALTSNLIMGRPGNTVFYQVVSEQMPSAVVEKAPFTISLEQPKAPLVQNGRLAYKVTIKREAEFKAPVKVWTLWRPPNVSGANEVTIKEGATETSFTLTAKSNAKGNWKLVVMGEAATDTGNVYNASNAADLRIIPAFTTGKMKLTAVEQGKECEVRIPITHPTPFEGEATASLAGTPGEVSTEPVKYTKDTKELVFKVKTTEKSPRGTHKSLYLNLAIPYGDGVVANQRTAFSGILRIDAPKPPEPEPVPEPKPQPTKTPDAKPGVAAAR